MVRKSIHKIKILNRYYRMTRFYSFLSGLILKTGIALAFFILSFLIFDYYFIDTQAILHTLNTKFSPLAILSIFFTSELLLGILPPEVFIAWSSKTMSPWGYVFLLGSVSYIVGLVVYYLGKMLFLISTVRKFIEVKIKHHIKHLRQWGGIFVFAGAMLPIPYTLVSFTSGLINFNVQQYMAWALFRYVRFFIYSLLIFRII